MGTRSIHTIAALLVLSACGDGPAPAPPDAGVTCPVPLTATQPLAGARARASAAVTAWTSVQPPMPPRPSRPLPRTDAAGRERLLVTLARGADASRARAAVEALDGRVDATLLAGRVLTARLSPGAARALARRGDVVGVHPDVEVRAAGQGTVAAQAAATSGEYTPALLAVQAPAVWDADGDGVLDPGAPTGAGIPVCVIDQGWDPRHPELAGAYVGGRDFVEDDDDPRDYDVGLASWGSGHGTHVAATALGRVGVGGVVAPGADARGTAGVAPGAPLLVARVLDVDGRGWLSDVLEAVTWCRGQGARVLQLSLSIQRSQVPADVPLCQAFADAAAAGVLAVSTSGNAGVARVDDPAGCPDVVAVGAVDAALRRAAFSQYGPELDLVAPGVRVLSAGTVGGTLATRVELEGAGPLASAPADPPTPGAFSGTLVDCGSASGAFSCGAAATCDGFVALVDLSDAVPPGEQVRRVRLQGAAAVVLADPNVDGTPLGVSLEGEGPWPPVVRVAKSAGAQLRAAAGRRASVEVRAVDYVELTGTSMATPHVSGAAALLWSAKPELTLPQLRAVLEDSARPLGDETEYGRGLLQTKDALDLLRSRHP